MGVKKHLRCVKLAMYIDFLVPIGQFPKKFVGFKMELGDIVRVVNLLLDNVD